MERYCFHSHFTVEKTEAQLGHLTEATQDGRTRQYNQVFVSDCHLQCCPVTKWLLHSAPCKAAVLLEVSSNGYTVEFSVTHTTGPGPVPGQSEMGSILLWLPSGLMTSPGLPFSLSSAYSQEAHTTPLKRAVFK